MCVFWRRTQSVRKNCRNAFAANVAADAAAVRLLAVRLALAVEPMSPNTRTRSCTFHRGGGYTVQIGTRRGFVGIELVVVTEVSNVTGSVS